MITRVLCALLFAAVLAPASAFANWGLTGVLDAAGRVLPEQGTRSQREEVERQLIDKAPNQAGPSSPTDRYRSVWRKDELPAEPKEQRAFLWDFGGWVRGTFTTFDTQVGVDRTLRDYDGRFWLKLGVTEYQSVYGRARTFFSDYNAGDGPGVHDDDWQNVRADQAFYEGQFARTFGMSPDIDLTLTAGRQFFFLGKGLALSNVLDGARFNGRFGETSFEIFGAQTVHFTPDLDSTIASSGLEDRNESDRQFAGASVSTWSFLQRRFYAYGMAEIDNNRYVDTAGGQAFAYRAGYFGLGGDGDIPIPGFGSNEFSYSVEAVVEIGRGTASGSLEREDIMAYGWLADFYWLPADVPWIAKTVLSYYFGSGDADRGSQLGTVGGNTLGTDDTALNYFGFVNTGYSLAPRLTNLHVGRLNAEFFVVRPVDFVPYAQEVKLGVSGYAFYKHHKTATMSDFTSIEDKSYVGSEANVYVDWAVLSDLDISVRYGTFFPGEAFSQNDSRQFVSAALTLSF